jgi:DNA-binding transcriptional regulator YdaS (Cro superfamily)
MRTKNPQLLEWLKTATDASVKKTGTSRAYLRLIAYGHKTASAEIAARTESATEGKVTRKDLRPDDWKQIWPELSVA